MSERLHEQLSWCHKELANEREKRFKQKERLDQVWAACEKKATGKISKGIFVDDVMRALDYPR